MNKADGLVCEDKMGIISHEKDSGQVYSVAFIANQSLSEENRSSSTK